MVTDSSYSAVLVTSEGEVSFRMPREKWEKERKKKKKWKLREMLM